MLSVMLEVTVLTAWRRWCVRAVMRQTTATWMVRLRCCLLASKDITRSFTCCWPSELTSLRGETVYILLLCFVVILCWGVLWGCMGWHLIPVSKLLGTYLCLSITLNNRLRCAMRLGWLLICWDERPYYIIIDYMLIETDRKHYLYLVFWSSLFHEYGRKHVTTNKRTVNYYLTNYQNSTSLSDNIYFSN